MEISASIEQGEQPIAVMKLKGAINTSNFMEVVDKAWRYTTTRSTTSSLT